jgi:hypothetical protein
MKMRLPYRKEKKKRRLVFNLMLKEEIKKIIKKTMKNP